MILKSATPTIALSFLAAFAFTFAASGEEKKPLKSTVFDWDTRIEKPTGVGIYRGVNDSPTETLERFECHITTLHAGNESHPPHQHPQEEFIILQEGELDVHINGEEFRIGAGGMFFFAAWDWHAVHNVGEGAATYLVFNYESGETRQIRKEPAAKWQPKGTLKSDVFAWKDGDGAQEFFNAPTVTLKNLQGYITTLAADKTTGTINHPAATLIAIRDGEVGVTLNGEESVVGRGSIIFVSSKDAYELRNTENSEASYYVFHMSTDKTPES